ncbi:V-type ATPase subunit [Tissierella creatinophila]|uniref:V-type ATP synthase subunit C n=1 Tax=Tissierella creatinophila DSM 6911 TaxID=1123403 RepID=A0A1U7M8M7_TISCR|nr:V-type ATPase subunit [Tissierella creatinophila]OLS03635.1 V-type ATP synthase subunit C [Tissierella creatinophila DSM 6911]
MSNERIFSAINTKIRVLKSNLLNELDYINLMKKKDLKSQIEYLIENTVYKKEMESIDDINSLEDVEFALRNHIIDQYEKILNFFTDEYRDLFKTLLLRYDIEFLKVYIRILERKDESIKLDKYTFSNEKYHSFNLAKIMKTSNLEEFVDSLKGTIYYNALLSYKDQKDKKTIFYMEMNLDKLYFNLLYTKSKFLGKKDRDLFQEILGINEDLLNIEWIYRGIKFYKLLPEELINFTLTHGFVFKYNDLKKMAYGTEEELIDRVLATKYEFLFNSEQEIDLYMDRRIHRYLYYMFLKLLKAGGLNIVLSIAYIHLLEYEAKDIISILEAKRYGLDIEEIKKYMIRSIERG